MSSPAVRLRVIHAQGRVLINVSSARTRGQLVARDLPVIDDER